MDEHRNADRSDLSHAYKYLTQYHLKFDQLDQANHYAQKCLQFDETKEEAKALLRSIAHKRAKVEENPMVVRRAKPRTSILPTFLGLLTVILFKLTADRGHE